MTASAAPARLSLSVSPSVPIAITMGDVCGIGPEIVAKAFIQGQAHGTVVVGDVEVMQKALDALVSGWRAVPVNSPQLAWSSAEQQMPVLVPQDLPAGLCGLPLGRIDARAGQAAASCIRQAVTMALDHQVAAVVTAPLHKEALSLAGVSYAGHTEMLQDLAGGMPVRMMLANEQLKTVLVTTHLALRRAIDALSVPLIVQTIQIAHAAARGWGLERPRIAVAGLNPHAGEGGLFGDEELRIIAPAVAQAQALGIAASGPHAPDTVFMRARQASDHAAEFDLVIAMYHDQGLIPVKYLGLAHGVNVTLGLPFVRTSPDHGTGFDIAGQGKAEPDSFLAALNMARRLSSGDGLTQ